MVVDDHPIWRTGVARDLSEHGFDVATAVDGAAALRIIPAARPDVVLMDLNFGSEEPSSPAGAETTRRIIDSWPDIRVLVLSASGAHADVLAAVQAGASGYLVKSASVEELVDAVRRTAEGDAVFTPAWPAWCSASTAGWPGNREQMRRPLPRGRPRCCARWPLGAPPGRSPTGW
jgi:DNA-binding NarL/FixJ family response regulator